MSGVISGINSQERAKNRSNFKLGSVERAIIDLVRVGSQGYGAGVKQVASKLSNRTPEGITEITAFRVELQKAMVTSNSPIELRFGTGTLPQDSQSTATLVDVDLLPDGSSLLVNSKLSRQLEELVSERFFCEEFSTAGIEMTKAVMLSGPPGVGKTLTASWIAQQLAVPLVSVDLSTVIASFLGNSGRNIHTIFEYAKSGPCVLFLDEFDAIAKKRDDSSDIGELKRLVSILLVEMDKWCSGSILLAATNHAHLLDPAVVRRFDMWLEFELPTAEERRALIFNFFTDNNSLEEAILDDCVKHTEGLSQSDLTKLKNKAQRMAVMYKSNSAVTFLVAVAKYLGLKNPEDENALLDRLSLYSECDSEGIKKITGHSLRINDALVGYI